MKSLSITALLCICSSFLFSQNIDSAQYYFKKGMDAKEQKTFAVAAGNFDKAINFNSNYTDAYVENGNVDLEMHRIDAAKGNFVKAYQLDSSNSDLIKKLAELYFDDRQFQKSITLIQKCSACENEEKFQKILGISYYNLEDYAKAELYLKKYIAINDKDAESQYTLGRTYLELEREKDAIPAFENAVSLAPDNYNWTYELGLIYYNQEDYKNALKYFKEAADKGLPRSGDYNENLGFAELYSGQKDSALIILNDLLAKKPSSTELITSIAYGLYQTKNYDDAFNYFQKEMNVNSNDASSLYMIGMIFQKKGDTAKGKKICDKAIEMNPSLAKNRQKMDMPMGL